jgi:hypothetical protein
LITGGRVAVASGVAEKHRNAARRVLAPPVVFWESADRPIAVLLLPVVLLTSALSPKNVLK